MRLTKLIFSTIFLLSGLQIATHAFGDVEGSGSFEIWGGQSDLSGISGISPYDDSYSLYNGSLSYQFPSSSDNSVQLDLGFEKTTLDDDESSELFQESIQLGIHISHHNSTSGRIGLLIGSGSTISDSGDRINGGEVDYWFAAFENQYVGDSVTALFQIGGLDSENKGDSNADNFRDAMFVRAGASLPVGESDNFSVDLAYADGVNDKDEDDSDVLEVNLRYENSLTKSDDGRGLRWFVGYRHSRNRSTVGEEYSDNTAYLGLRFVFSGKSTGTLSTPGFGRWVATGEIFD